MQPFMTYNEDQAVKAGGGLYVSEGGAYVMKITEARYIESGTKGTKGIEFSAEDKDGMKANYLTSYYEKATGEAIPSGQSLINAIMGLCGIKSTTFKEVKTANETYFIVPEFTGKVVGLFLQKNLYTKSDGRDGYKFEIRVPFDPKTKRTLREIVANAEAKTIDAMEKSYKDNDDRGATSKATGQTASNAGGWPDDGYENF